VTWKGGRRCLRDVIVHLGRITGAGGAANPRRESLFELGIRLSCRNGR
jgi:hypothetical protein